MFNWFNLASYIILIPAVIAAVRFSTMDNAFKPLAYNLWIGVATEITAHIFRVTIRNNLYVYNVFMLLDLFTFLWLFKNWGAFSRISRQKEIVFLSAFLLIWLFDNFYLSSLGSNNIIFRIVYSMTLLLIAITQLNNVIIKNNGYLKFNPYIYICIGVIFYYAYSIFIGLFNSPLFTPTVVLWKWNMLIYVIINVLTNLLFAISLLWMQKKVKYI